MNYRELILMRQASNSKCDLAKRPGLVTYKASASSMLCVVSSTARELIVLMRVFL